MTEPSARTTPQHLADFEIIRRLGVGGMAEVFLAKKRGAEGTYKLLVVKRILPQYGSSRRFRTMFAEEAQLATRLNHPNIVQVYDFQDYGEDGPAAQHGVRRRSGPAQARCALRRPNRTRLPPYVAAFIVAEVAKGLHYAHERRDEAGRTARHRAPRRLAAEHPAQLRRQREDRRLRHRFGQPVPRGARRAQGQDRLHVARARRAARRSIAAATSTRSAWCSTNY